MAVLPGPAAGELHADREGVSGPSPQDATHSGVVHPATVVATWGIRMLKLPLLVAFLVACSQPPAKTVEPAPPKQAETPARAVSGLERRTWTQDGKERIALLHIPADASKKETPVVFAFHGHGGNARQASNSFRMHEVWPEAIVVYMEGLPTPGALTDPKGERNGWQHREGMQDDRDLKFFDAVLASIKKDCKVDERRIYAMGHSNGGSFTYVLWKARPDVFAAFAPSGTYTGQARTLKPKPAMHIAGKKDELVKFSYQEATIEAIRKVDGCEEKGTEWARDCTRYESGGGTPVITMLYDGTHKYPAEAPPLIARFFKEQAKPALAAPAPAPKAKPGA